MREREHEGGQLDDQHDGERGTRSAEIRQVIVGAFLATRSIGLHVSRRPAPGSNSSAFKRNVAEMSSSPKPRLTSSAYSSSMRSTTGNVTPKRAAISRQMPRSFACRRTRKPAGYVPRTMFG